MQKRKEHFTRAVSRAALLAAGLLGWTATMAPAAVLPEQISLQGSLTAPAFLGGLPVGEPRTTSAASVVAYHLFDAEALGRFLLAAPDGPGIDPMQTAAIIPGG